MDPLGRGLIFPKTLDAQPSPAVTVLNFTEELKSRFGKLNCVSTDHSANAKQKTVNETKRKRGIDPELVRLSAELRGLGNRKRAEGEKKYLKSDLEFLGTGVPALRSVAKHWKRDHPNATRQEVLDLAAALWDTRVHELRTLGVALLDLHGDLLQAGDMAFVEDLLNKANTWAHVDCIAVGVAGTLVARFAGAKRVLTRWSKDDNFWVRRSAMLALLNPLRAGEGDFHLFARFSSQMIEEKEFFIRKAIGWMLREVAKKRPKLTYDFLSEHITVVSGLTLREGAKYLPTPQRNNLMQRYKSR